MKRKAEGEERGKDVGKKPKVKTEPREMRMRERGMLGRRQDRRVIKWREGNEASEERRTSKEDKRKEWWTRVWIDLRNSKKI